MLLEDLKDSNGRVLWAAGEREVDSLRKIFDVTPPKTKLEQFFQLLFLLQRRIPEKLLPLTVGPPRIAEILITAGVFKTPDFPRKITEVELKQDGPNSPPRYRVSFSDPEVRFPINEGRGFSVWEQGMCQVARDLVFYPGFSFTLRKARNSKNLVVNNFSGVELYGDFGTRKIFSIDLNYVDLKKVEFIEGTDQGKVTSRVARREFKENPHSKFFKFIGSLIPNTSRQRIDW